MVLSIISYKVFSRGDLIKQFELLLAECSSFFFSSELDRIHLFSFINLHSFNSKSFMLVFRILL